MMLHQGFPHLHHQHEDSHSHSDIVHSGEDHHHDNDSEEKEKSSYGFFNFVLEMHSHSSLSSDTIILKNNSIKKQTDVNKDVAKSIVNNLKNSLFKYRHYSKAPIYNPPNTHFNSYLDSLDSRGPPSLG